MNYKKLDILERVSEIRVVIHKITFFEFSIPIDIRIETYNGHVIDQHQVTSIR